MSASRKPWSELKPATRDRYRRAGISQHDYERGVPIPITRGTPQRRTPKIGTLPGVIRFINQ